MGVGAANRGGGRGDGVSRGLVRATSWRGGLDQMGGGLDQRFDPHGTAGTNLSQTSAGGREGLGAGGLGGLPSWGSLEPRRESREPVWAGGGALAPPPDELEPLGGGLEPLGGGVPDAPEAAGALASFERGLSGELGGGVGAPPPGVSSGALPFSDWSVPVDPSRQAADEVISPPAPPPTNPPRLPLTPPRPASGRTTPSPLPLAPPDRPLTLSLTPPLTPPHPLTHPSEPRPPNPPLTPPPTPPYPPGGAC